MEMLETLLPRLTGAHDALLERAIAHRDDVPSVDVALCLGAGVRIHQVMMELIPDSLRLVADEEVLAELGTEVRGLEDNLEYLHSLRDAEPDSPDLATLSAALVERIRQHLERTERVLFRPLQRLYREHE